MRVAITANCQKQIANVGIRPLIDKLIERGETNKTLRPFFDPHLPCWKARVGKRRIMAKEHKMEGDPILVLVDILDRKGSGYRHRNIPTEPFLFAIRMKLPTPSNIMVAGSGSVGIGTSSSGSFIEKSPAM